MQRLQTRHNEKLHYNIGHYCPLVNPFNTHGVDKSGNADKKKVRCLDYDYYVDNLDEYIEKTILAKFAGNDDVINVNLFGRKQYVKISNTVFDLQLKPKVLEFYCILSYMAYSDPSASMSIRSLSKQFQSLTHQSIDKDTVHRYLTTLINKGLVVRNINNHKRMIVGSNIVEIIKNDMLNYFCNLDTNYYLEPVSRWTPYYIGMVQAKGRSAIELVTGSVKYVTHNIQYLGSRLSSSSSTIYAYLKDLIEDNVIHRTSELLKVSKFITNYKPMYKYRYHNTIREAYNEFNDRLRLSKNAYQYHLKVMKKRKTNNHPNRKWYVGKIGYYVNKYSIKINKVIMNFSPSEIVWRIERMEDIYTEELNARMIMSSLVGNY
jgi:predicted transcriptional regulator